MSRIWLWLANQVSALSPATTGFALRGWLFRRAGVALARSAKVCGSVRFDNPHAVVGPGSWIGGGCRFIGAPDAPVVIGHSCDLGPDVLLVTGTHEIGGVERRAGKGLSRPVIVGDGVWVGARSTILPGAVVGAGCVIAAGAVVRGEIPNNRLVGGVPATVLRELS